MHGLRDFARSHQVFDRLLGRTVRQDDAPAAPIRVLVVDDEPQVCTFVSRVLESAGYRVQTAESGPAAIAAVELHGPPDLLLTDLKMPGMDGDELAARLRQSTPDLKVLYLTGFSQTLFNRRTMLWDGEAFLEKPCSPSGLLQGISQLLFDRSTPPSAAPHTPGVGELFSTLPKNRR